MSTIVKEFRPIILLFTAQNFNCKKNKTMNIRTWNSLLGALASSAKVDNSIIVFEDL